MFLVKSNESAISPRFYILQFIKQNQEKPSSVHSSKVSFNVSEQSKQRIKDLELELIKKQEYLQVVIEELETTNEELQASNEELMSSNEELQSTNEELQSVNEELHTVNSEYQEKITELTEANSDLDSVINSTDIGIIFLDDQLTIRKFTKSATEYLNFLSTDIGRPLHHISHDLVYKEFLEDVAFVSANNQIIEKNIQTTQGAGLLVRILPYRENEYRAQRGVLITLTNISRLRFVEQAFMRAQEQIRSNLLSTSDLMHRKLSEEKTLQVLLLDDNEADRAHIKRMIGNLSRFEIKDYATVEAAVASLKKLTFDIGIIDYKLNDGLTANDFVQRIQQANLSLPIVILSGYTDVDLRGDLLDIDVFDFINKDEITAQLLSRSIDYVIEKNLMQKAIQEVL